MQYITEITLDWEIDSDLPVYEEEIQVWFAAGTCFGDIRLEWEDLDGDDHYAYGMLCTMKGWGQ